MARHARLVAPPLPARQDWPWHKAKWGTVALADLRGGDRRLEAESYLTSGHGLRLAIERKRQGWRRLADIAKAWQPLRLKGIQVAADEGTPFLAATQVFDVRPTPRKWLALERTPASSQRFVTRGQILVTCSGAVGRATLAYAPHQDILVSHDLLRVDARDASQRGWIYAYLRAPQTRAMMSSAQYGHIIKHLETAHLDGLPVPEIDGETAAGFERHVARLLELRDRSYQATLEAEHLFEQAIGPVGLSNNGEQGFSVSSSGLAGGRRRLEAGYWNPLCAEVREALRVAGKTSVPVRELGFDVWLPMRFRRIPANDGVSFWDSSDIFEISPDITKRIADCGFGDPYNGRIRAGWLLLARSGQTYGLNGTVTLATEEMEGKVISDHVMRIAPRKGCSTSAAYLSVALSHPVLGRPLVKALAYGSSIPEIDPADFSEFPVVRLEREQEAAIAELAAAGAQARAEADALEWQLAEDAGRIIDRFIAGAILAGMNSPLHSHDGNSRTAPLAEHARVRLRKALPEHHLRAGATGTVVHLYRRGGIEVEFGAATSSPKVVTLDTESVEPVAD